MTFSIQEVSSCNNFQLGAGEHGQFGWHVMSPAVAGTKQGPENATVLLQPMEAQIAVGPCLRCNHATLNRVP